MYREECVWCDTLTDLFKILGGVALILFLMASCSAIMYSHQLEDPNSPASRTQALVEKCEAMNGRVLNLRSESDMCLVDGRLVFAVE